MGPKHTEDEILASAVAVASAHGLSQLSFGRVGKHLGISDRTVVYYFPTKADLISAVVGAIGSELQAALDRVVAAPAADHRELLGRAWPVLAHPDADSAFALFFEANGLATAGRAPYDQLVPILVAAWIDWAAGHIEGASEYRRAEAELTIALADGLLLFRQIAGPDAAQRAADRLGIT